MKILLLLLGCLAAAPAIAADQGFALGYDYWDYQVSGLVNDDGTQFRLHRDLGIRPLNRDSFFLRWDTGSGWWPDLAAHYQHVQLYGDEAFSGNGLQIGPIGLLPSTTSVSTNVDVHDTELTLSYPLPTGWLHSAAGVNVKSLKGHIDLVQNGSNNRQEVNELFPMLHLDLGLPLGDFFRLFADGNWIEYGGEGAYEFSGGAEFRLLGPLTLSAGWQRKHYAVDESYTLHATLQGLLLGMHLVFE